MKLSDVYKIIVNGVDRTGFVEEFSRQVSICEGIETLQVKFDISIGTDTINIFDKIEVYEDSNLVKTFFVDDITVSVPTKSITITSSDMKRIKDYFIPENYILDYPSTPKYWIEKFINDAGASVIFTTPETGGYLSNNTSLGMTSLYEQLQTLLQVAGWYMRTNESGNIIIGDLIADRTPKGIINKVINFRRIQDDKNLRNRGVVWGSYNPDRKYWVYSDVYKPTPWDIDYNDKRTVVMSNSYIKTIGTANYLANKIVDTFNHISNIITVDVEGFSGLDVGDTVYIDLPWYRGLSILTSYNKYVSPKGAIETLTFNEECPRLFAYWGWSTDWIYTATDKGIYRKQMITASGQDYTWYDYSQGLPDIRPTPFVKVSNGLMVTIVESGNAYYRDAILETPWREVVYSGHVCCGATTGNNIYLGYNFSGNYEINKLNYYGNLENVVVGSGEIIDIDALYGTIGFVVTYSGDPAPQNSSYYNFIMESDSGFISRSNSEYFTSMAGTPRIYEEFVVASGIYEFDPSEILGISSPISSIHYNILTDNNKDYCIYNDYDSGEIGIIVSTRDTYINKIIFGNFTNLNIVPREMAIRGNEIVALYQGDKDSDGIYHSIGVLRINKDTYNYTFNTIYSTDASHQITWNGELLAVGNSLGVVYTVVPKFISEQSVVIRYYLDNGITISSGEIGSFDGDENTSVSNISSNKLCIDTAGAIMMGIRSYDSNSGKIEVYLSIFIFNSFGHNYYTFKTIDSDSSSYIGDSTLYLSGADRRNGIGYIVNVFGNGVKIYFNSLTAYYGSIDLPPLQYLSDSSLIFRFIEDRNNLYCVIEDANANAKYLYNISTHRYIPIQSINSLEGVDEDYFIFANSNSINIMNKNGNVIYSYNTNNQIAYGQPYIISIISGTFKYVRADNSREVFVSPMKYEFSSGDEHGSEVFIMDEEILEPKSILKFPGKRYKIVVGNTLIYLYPEIPLPTYISTLRLNEYVFVNNNLNNVTMPREIQNTTVSGNIDRELIAISTNNPLVTDLSLYDIINSEYNIIASGNINIPEKGNVLEATNFELKDYEGYSKIILSNGVDKIFESYGGGIDFYDVTNNIINDYDITNIYWIAVDDDL